MSTFLRSRKGGGAVPVRDDDVHVPLGTAVSTIEPRSIRVVTERKVTKKVPVSIRTTNRLPEKLRLAAVSVSPSTIAIEGPERAVARVMGVEAEEVDLAGIDRSTVMERKIVSPDPSVKILHDDKVRISVRTSRVKAPAPKS
jgi:diadenylate cyclase